MVSSAWRTWDIKHQRVPVPGETQPQLGASDGGAGCSKGWVLGGTLGSCGCPNPGLVVHHGVLEELGRDPSHRVLAPPDLSQNPSGLLGLAGLITGHIICSWPLKTHPDTHHLCMALLDSSRWPSSSFAPARPILAPIISSCSSWTYLGAHYLCLTLLGPSWCLSSPAPGQPILGHHFLLLLDPSWCPPSCS